MKFVLVGLLLVFSTALAQTEVEGEVSGEWNTEGNPYIVVGDITIPAEDTLTILQGVEVSILSELSIIVHGVLITEGSEEERVVIHGDEENEAPWTGIFFDKPDDTSTMAYSDITDCEICITLDATHDLELDNCSFNGINNALFAERDIGDYRVITASNCVFNSGGDTGTIDVYAGELIANDCTFLSLGGAVVLGGVQRLTDCTIVGTILCHFGVIEITNCDITRPEGRLMANVIGRTPTRGFVRNCNIEGSLSIFSHDAPSFHVTDSVIERNVHMDDCQATLTNNTIGVDSLVTVEIEEGRVVMENNAVNGELDLRDTRFTITSSSFHKIEIRGEDGDNSITGNTITEELEIREGGQLMIEKNKIGGEISIRDAINTIFRHNTIVAIIDISRASTVNFTQNTIATPEPTNIDNQEMIDVGSRGSHIIVNSNIFIGTYANSLFYMSYEEDHEIEMNYNCFWMIDNYNRRNPYNENIFLRDHLNETNIITNPLLFDSDPLNIALQPISPCRNTGDPDLDDDPDETRADMGAVFFDHRIDHVSGIHSPEVAFAQRGEYFRYAVKGSDEEEVNFELIGLPEWLQPAEGRDIVEDSLILDGNVPDE